RTGDVAAAVAAAQAAEPATARHQATGTATAARPRAPRQPKPPTVVLQPVKPRRRWAGPARAVVVLAILVAILGSAAWIASRGVFFVGTDEQGFVTLYRGLPYELPGLKLYNEEFESGVPMQALPARARQTVEDHELRSEDDARDLIRRIEQGELAGQG
ncbi:MAG: hypothetical protein HZB46_11345, partial [Solirubrobacterales bacterium]|nr:hypothetical protein [Solirubrobacterales bacterium]